MRNSKNTELVVGPTLSTLVKEQHRAFVHAPLCVAIAPMNKDSAEERSRQNKIQREEAGPLTACFKQQSNRWELMVITPNFAFIFV